MKFGLMYYKQTDNIGDDFQTYAAKRFLKHIDYYIDRETMDAFVPNEKDYVALIMNGWYMNNKLTWPPSPYIYPHLVSMHFTNAGLFNVGETYLKGKVSNYLNRFEKVGCRDNETIKRLEKNGVKNCYFTGCMTLTLNKFQGVEKQDYICAVDLNENLVEKIKQSTNKEVKVITQNNYELVNMTFEERMKETEKVLKTFQGASVVITRRLHAMLPSIALGTPVVLLKQDGYENEKDRFQDFASFAGNTFTIKDFLNMDISNIINNPTPNSEAYLKIRNNLINSCENFIKTCENIQLDTSKLPDIEQYKSETEEQTSWNNEVGTAVVEYEKAKQKEYVENWDAREKWIKKVEEEKNNLYQENENLKQQKYEEVKETKNILLCCNSMGIGGVETVILNQVIAFCSKGYGVYVMAEKGEYSNKIEELGGIFIEMKFPEENEINKDRVKTIINIIKEKKITEIHIHKYQCIPSILISALITRTPYFAYEHGIKDTKKYYTWNYPIYKALFPIYYKNAYKIIAITPKVAEITKNEYGFKDDKYAIVHNGIDFDTYQNDNPNYDNNIKNVLIVSRLDKEKLPTIYNGIEAYRNLKKIYPEVKLNIVGGGNAEQEIIEYLNKVSLKSTYEDEDVPVKFFGKQTDVKKYLKQNDILLGVGRCILEAIAMKVPAIITGYDGINGLVTGENINLAMDENFSGFNMYTVNEKVFEEQILDLKQNRKKIIDEVYESARQNLDCYKNYISLPDKQELNMDWFSLFENLKENIDLIEKQSEDIRLKYEWIQKIETDNKQIEKENKQLKEENKQLEEENKQLEEEKHDLMNENKKLTEINDELQKNILNKEEEINSMKNELNEIYNSKRWRYVNKIANMFGK